VCQRRWQYNIDVLSRDTLLAYASNFSLSLSLSLSLSFSLSLRATNTGKHVKHARGERLVSTRCALARRLVTLADYFLCRVIMKNRYALRRRAGASHARFIAA